MDIEDKLSMCQHWCHTKHVELYNTSLYYYVIMYHLLCITKTSSNLSAKLSVLIPWVSASALILQLNKKFELPPTHNDKGPKTRYRSSLQHLPVPQIYTNQNWNSPDSNAPNLWEGHQARSTEVLPWIWRNFLRSWWHLALIFQTTCVWHRHT